MKETNPRFEWHQLGKKQCMILTFSGYFTTRDAHIALERLNVFLNERRYKLVMIWDATEMTGYDHEARALWATGIKDKLQYIETIHLVSPSVLIRVGGRVVGTLMGYPVRCWQSMRLTIRHLERQT